MGESKTETASFLSILQLSILNKTFSLADKVWFWQEYSCQISFVSSKV